MFILYNEAIEKAMREDPYIPPSLVDDINKPLAFQSEQNGSTVALQKVGSAVGDFEISRDGGKWEDYIVSTPITLNRGHYVSFRAKTTAGAPDKSYWHFVMSGKINAYNNINSMASSEYLSLSEIEQRQFQFLFDGCTALYKAPLISSVHLYVDKYTSAGMGRQYEGLFRGCASLMRAPELPLPNLRQFCCASMFEGCSSLVEAPNLPNVPLSMSCFGGMFKNCKSLIKAPELFRETLPMTAYNAMFKGCSNLREVRCHLTEYPTNPVSTLNWLDGVAETGDFYCDPSVEYPTGASGIPEGWVRHDIADYPN